MALPSNLALESYQETAEDAARFSVDQQRQLDEQMAIARSIAGAIANKIDMALVDLIRAAPPSQHNEATP